MSASDPALRAFGIRPRWVVLLVVGRGAFRATSQLAPLLLVAAWGQVRFGTYAGAIGLSTWTMFVAFSGEKTVLKLLPRTRRIGPQITRVAFAVAAAPLVCALLAAGIGLTMRAAPSAMLLLTAVLWSAAVGFLQLVAAMHRLRGRPGHDAAAFLALACLVAITTLATVLFGWSTLRQLTGVSLAALAVLVVMLLRLPRRDGVPPRRRVTARVLRACLLLGLPELLGAVAVAACYLGLRLGSTPQETGRFYVAVVASSFCGAALIYLLRIAAPATSVRQRGPGAACARQRARRVLVVAIAGSAACSVGLALAALSGVRQTGWLPLATLTAVEVPLFALVSYASYLLENTDGRVLAVTSGAAIAGLAGTALAVPMLVPALGAAGAMGSLVVGLGVAACGMRAGLARQHPSRFSRRRWDRAYARIVRDSFATVPFYREHWALTGGPGAVATAGEVRARPEDLTPLGDPIPVDGPVTSVGNGLGSIAAQLSCGLWHLDTQRVYARNTDDGLAVTLLRQRSPRLVDVVADAPLSLAWCPSHGSPVVNVA